MVRLDSKSRSHPSPGGGNFWAHVLVSACACALTVSIVGSAVFLAWRVYDRHQLKNNIEIFVSSLENRSEEELEARVIELKSRPKLAAYVLPEIAKGVVDSRSERRQWAAIQVSRAFLDHPKIEKALFLLRGDYRENISAAAVEALSDLQPPQKAAEVMGQCLVDGQAAAADEACAALYRLGEVGRDEMKQRLPELSVGRRIWLVRYISAVSGPHQRNWLRMLGADEDERVRTAASEALSGLTSGQDIANPDEASFVAAPR